MRFNTLLAALASALTVSAFPTTNSVQSSICSCDTSSSVGATLFKQANPTTCGSVATNFTTVPTDQGCFNMSSMYGGWENSVEALVVAKGVECNFYSQPDCPAQSTPLCLGEKAEPVIETPVPEEYRGKIRSVSCQKM